MPSLGDILFGREPSIQNQQETVLDADQRRVLASLLGQFEEEGLGEFRGEQFQGDLSAGLTGGEQLSLAALEQQALNRVGGQTEGADALSELISNRGATGSFEDFYRTNVRDPAVEEFQNQVLPNIIRDFGGAQFASSERAEADTEARGDLLEELVRSRSALAFQERQSAADRLLQAIGLESATGTGEVQQLLGILGGLGTGREVEQADLDREYQDFLRQLGQGDTRIAQILQALNTRSIENIVGVDPGSAGLVQLLLAGAASGAGQGLGTRIGGGN